MQGDQQGQLEQDTSHQPRSLSHYPEYNQIGVDGFRCLPYSKWEIKCEQKYKKEEEAESEHEDDDDSENEDDDEDEGDAD